MIRVNLSQSFIWYVNLHQEPKILSCAMCKHIITISYTTFNFLLLLFLSQMTTISSYQEQKAKIQQFSTQEKKNATYSSNRNFDKIIFKITKFFASFLFWEDAVLVCNKINIQNMSNFFKLLLKHVVNQPREFNYIENICDLLQHFCLINNQ